VVSSGNLYIGTATAIAVGSRLFVYVRKSKGPSLEPVELHAQFVYVRKSKGPSLEPVELHAQQGLSLVKYKVYCVDHESQGKISVQLCHRRYLVVY